VPLSQALQVNVLLDVCAAVSANIAVRTEACNALMSFFNRCARSTDDTEKQYPAGMQRGIQGVMHIFSEKQQAQLVESFMPWGTLLKDIRPATPVPAPSAKHALAAMHVLAATQPQVRVPRTIPMHALALAQGSRHRALPIQVGAFGQRFASVRSMAGQRPLAGQRAASARPVVTPLGPPLHPSPVVTTALRQGR